MRGLPRAHTGAMGPSSTAVGVATPNGVEGDLEHPLYLLRGARLLPRLLRVAPRDGVLSFWPRRPSRR